MSKVLVLIMFASVKFQYTCNCKIVLTQDH
uniref:Uncharacterized protein n=1 Tax=Arundo donax TaxID=35708 RepID=A0A0A9BU10_ARUDO